MSEHLTELELAEVGAGLPAADRLALAEALAAQRTASLPQRCAGWTPAQRACLAGAASLADASTCAGGLAARSRPPSTDRQPPLPVLAGPEVSP